MTASVKGEGWRLAFHEDFDSLSLHTGSAAPTV